MSANARQEEALNTFKETTSIQSDAVARDSLERADWNVEAAVGAFFDGDSSTMPQREPVEDTYPSRTFSTQPPNNSFTAFGRSNFLARLIVFPFSLVFTIVTPIFALIGRILHLPRPNLPSFSLRPLWLSSSTSSIHKLDPATCAERTVRALEEELGVHASQSASFSSAVASNSRSGPSPAGRRLPNFHIGSYDSALAKAKAEIRPLCIILFTNEHQDVDVFKRSILLDQDLIKTLDTRQFVVWIGDVKYSDAYQTSRILEATTYPFIAFITLSPPRLVPGTTASAHGAPKMTVFSRLEGPPSTVTAPAALVNHINSTVIPRTSSYMDRLRREKTSRDAERLMRAEQDRAYEEAAARDAERIRGRERQIEESRLEAAAIEKTQREGAARAENAAQWRTWARKHLVPLDTPPSNVKGATARLSVKLPDGRRLMRTFASNTRLEQLYAWVDTEANTASTSEVSAKPLGYEHRYTFSLCTMFPKRALDLDEYGPIRTVGEIDGLCPNASLVAEGLAASVQDDEEVEE